jgi:hypothetical protein
MDLSTQNSVGSALLIAVSVPGEPVTTFSTYWKDLSVGGINYVGLGSLISITESRSDLRAAPQDLSIAISGLVSSNLDFVRNNILRGSPISILRYIFNPVTGVGLSISDNPTGRFHGIVTNYTIDYTADPASASRTGSVTINLQCSSVVEQLNNKISGRRTSSEDMKKFYPGDLSMDRVSSLARTNFNFGAPK